MRMMYGGPPKPAAVSEEIKKALKTLEDPPIEVGPPIEVERPEFSPDPDAKRKLRVTSRVDEKGQIRLKIYLDGKLVSESSAEGTTVTVETEL